MRRRFAVLSVATVLGLVAFSPVLNASASSTAAAKKPPKDSAGSGSTTSSTGKSASKKSSTTPSTPSQGSPSQGSPSQGSPSQGSPSQGSPSQGSPSQSSSNCRTPETAHEPAPAQGTSQSYQAAGAGSVDLQRTSGSDLKVANVTANTGWTYKVISPSGPRVTVRFINQSTPSSVVHFAAQMDQAGRDIHVRVTSC